MSKDKGTRKEEVNEQDLSDEFTPTDLPTDPNEKLFQFLENNNLDFTALPFTDNYVYVPGQGVIIFTSPQLIYKAKVKNAQ